MTVVINLLAGSGAGKSTCAADLFAKMKHQQYHCELVTEYVKKWAWQSRKPTPFDQFYLAGKQSQSESQLYGKVDYIVTDSPIILSGFYEAYHLKREIVLPAVLNFLSFAQEKGVVHKNFFLKRNKPFDPRGRFETAEQAVTVDLQLRDFLESYSIPYTDVDVSDEYRPEFILEFLRKEAL